MVGIPAVLAFIGASLVAGGSTASLLGSLIMPLIEHDPLELWLLGSPWGQKKTQDSDKLDLQLARFYPALAGLEVECVFGMPDSFFSLTIRCRLTQDPDEVWLGYSYVSEAGAFRRAFSPLTANERVPGQPGTFALKVFASSPKLVTVEVQFRPRDPEMPSYPERPLRPKPFTT